MGACTPASPFRWRAIAPASGSTVTSARPRLRWTGTGTDSFTRIQICADRGCRTVAADFLSAGSEATPPSDLPPGYWFWRLRPATGSEFDWTSPWLLRVRRRAPGYAPIANTAAAGFSDYDGDGYPDFAMFADLAAYVYFGGPDGLSDARGVRLDGVGTVGGNIFLDPGTDINGDGFTDFASTRALAVEGQSWPQWVAWIEFGSLTGFRSVTATSAFVEVINGYYPLWIGEPGGLGDFDGDGYGDLIVTMRYGAAMIRGCAPAPDRSRWGSFACGNCQMQQVATGDFDGDGRSDVVYADGSGIRVYAGNPMAIGGVAFAGSGGVTVIDFNYDGYADLLVRRGSDDTLEAHEGGPVALAPAASEAPQPPPFLLAGDFDGDGWWDTIASSATGSRPLTAEIAYGGPGGWGAPPARTAALDRAIVNIPAAVVDLNADGYDDVLIDGPSPGETSFYAGSPAGLATSPTTIVAREPVTASAR